MPRSLASEFESNRVNHDPLQWPAIPSWSESATHGVRLVYAENATIELCPKCVESSSHADRVFDECRGTRCYCSTFAFSA